VSWSWFYKWNGKSFRTGGATAAAAGVQRLQRDSRLNTGRGTIQGFGAVRSAVMSAGNLGRNPPYLA
jgi:hypothetical protein